MPAVDLLCLPMELRLEIYRHVFHIDIPAPENLWLPLLLINKRIYTEVLTVLNEAHLWVRIPPSSSVKSMIFHKMREPDPDEYKRELACEGLVEDKMPDCEDEKAVRDFQSYCHRFARVTLQIGVDS